MRAFEYASPGSIEEAVALLAEKPGQAVVLAGGTDLLSLMKDRIETPSRLVNIKGIDELRGIGSSDGDLRIGPLVTLDELLGDDRIREDYPALWHAAEGVRSPQIRSAGTVGGDLCQRPRCWYFRNGFGLLATNGGTSMVTGGDNRYHAILGNQGPAYFVSPSSLAPALVAFDASLSITGPEGQREVPAASWFRIPATEGEREHDLAPAEIVTEIRIPPAAGRRSATYEVRQREVMDWPLAAASCVLEMDGVVVRRARVVLGHVAPVPWDARGAAGALVGKAVDAKSAGKAGEAAVSGARALSRNAHKIQLASVATKRAILRAVGEEV